MHSHSLSVSFLLLVIRLYTILPVLVTADVRPFRNNKAFADGTYGNYTRQRFLSDRDVVAPVANVYVPAQDGTSPGRHVTWSPVGPYLTDLDAHPMLLDAETLSLVYYGPRHDVVTMGPSVHSCNGTQYLTFWSGAMKQSRLAGNFYMYNSKYELTYNVSSVGDLAYSDAHEFYLGPRCTAVITAFQPQPYNLSHLGIDDGYILESYFQEIDLATGQLLFQWKALDHVDLMDALWIPSIEGQGQDVEGGFDWFHLNSIDRDRLGNYLLSARHTCTLYYVSGVTGEVLWTIGGKHSSFKDISGGRASDFMWQHHARWLDVDMTRISLFDNRDLLHRQGKGKSSRGMIISLDYERKEVRLEQTYPATHGINSSREGGMQILNDSPQPGNALVSYGSEPAWTEYSANGTVLWDVAFGPFDLDRHSPDNYRTAKVNWTGKPTWPPKIAPGPKLEHVFFQTWSTFVVRLGLEDGDRQRFINDTVYLSWNGATEVRSWIVLASNDSAQLRIDKDFWAEVPKTGFEDNVFVGAGTKNVLALAVDADDHVLGVTAPVNLSAFELREGSMDGLAELTVQWRAYVAQHGKSSLVSKLQTQWHKGVEASAALIVASRAHPAAAAGIGASGLLVVLALLCVPVCLCCRRSGRRYIGRRPFYSSSLAPVDEHEKDAFALAMDDEDSEDEDADSRVESGNGYQDDLSDNKQGKGSERDNCRASESSNSAASKLMY